MTKKKPDREANVTSKWVMAHELLWAQKFSREKLSSDLRIANFKPKSLSLKPICAPAEQCWKEYLNQFCCSHWGFSSPAKSKKDPGSLLPGGDDDYSVLCCPLCDLEGVTRVGLTWILLFQVIPSFWGAGGQGNRTISTLTCWKWRFVNCFFVLKY